MLKTIAWATAFLFTFATAGPVRAQAAANPMSATATATAPATAAGKYERVSVHGASLVGNLAGDSPDRYVSVHLPPSYAKEPKRRYPVLYFLHGFGSDDARLFQPREGFAGLSAHVDRAYAHGTREMIIVLPNAYTKFKGSMYSSSPVTGDWETFVTSELVSYIDQHYRTLARPESRGLAGNSMGGYGTLRLGMKHPHIFHSLYALNPCCLAAQMVNLTVNVEDFAMVEKVQTTKDIEQADFFVSAMLAGAAAWSPNPRKPPLYIDLPAANGKLVPDVIAKWAANAPLTLAHQYLPNLRTYDGIAFDAGTKETYAGILDTVKELDEVLKAYDIRHTTEIYEGDHNDFVMERFETKVLPFFSERLKF